ncbi:hypothetical protein PCANC_05759 [Puccinia coronata f. sp. avenae]|nr:hypothetical protein PCANC_05759 [Puccinia coronata f. sp. avenae]
MKQDLRNLSTTANLEGFLVLVSRDPNSNLIVTGGSLLGEQFIDMMSKRQPNPWRSFFSYVSGTAGINRSNTAVRAVLEQPCLTGGRTSTVRPKHLPPGRTGLSDQFLGPVAQDQPGPVAQDQPGPVGQICPTSWLLLRSDSARPTTGRTRMFEHRSNCCVQPVNAGSVAMWRWQMSPAPEHQLYLLGRSKIGYSRTH